MAQESGVKIQGFINFPRQKLSNKKKNKDWYKTNADYAENILTTDHDLRAGFSNKKVNYNLRANIINRKDFEKRINPDKLDLDTMPATFEHIGIENTKLNLLLGEYSKRRKEYRAYLSSNDQEGISRKEKQLKSEMSEMLKSIITGNAKSDEEVQRELQDFEKYARYDFQDIAEITANKLMKKEYKEKNFDFTFLRTFEDLLVGGEQIVYCGVLGGEPVMRRVNPMNLYTLGGNSMFIEDSDVIVEYDYLSVGQVIDDYWDELTEKDISFLENGTSANSSAAIGLNRDISLFDRFGEQGAVELFHPNELGAKTFGGAFDTNGNVRVMRVCWRSRRKIGKRKYYDEDGQEQFDYVDEDYVAKKDLGEEVDWKWVNEWLEATKIADDVYVNMRPIPYSGKSLTNRSKGTPPYIGSVNSTNGYRVQSLSDIMKPMAYSYDIAYYKRELEIATYKGNFAAINSQMIPSGWEPEEWIRYITVNKFGFLDPTNEILKGPSQGKSAGAFNTLTATNVQLGDPQAIQMYTNILLDIENTLGKLAGVTGAREGQIQNREAVGNVEREVAQTSHITEKWFAIDANFRKRALTKYLECIKFAYKKYPQKAQYLLDDMGMVMLEKFDEFAASEMDIHISNSSEDTALYQDIKNLSQAAIQNGQAKIKDLLAISQSESVQEIGRKLEESAEQIKRETDEREQANRESNENIQKMANEAAMMKMENDNKNNEADRQVEYAKIEADKWKVLVSEQNKDNIEGRRLDSDNNGIADTLDLERTEIDKNHKESMIRLKDEELAEKKRANLANEKIKEKQSKQKEKKSTAS